MASGSEDYTLQLYDLSTCLAAAHVHAHLHVRLFGGRDAIDMLWCAWWCVVGAESMEQQQGQRCRWSLGFS